MAIMTPTMEAGTTRHLSQTREEASSTLLAYQALYLGFIVAPILAGADKFFNYLVNWEQYLAPLATEVTGLSAPMFMRVVGIVEIIAGLGVLFMPRIFGYVVSAWLIGIVVNLLILGEYYDIALRDFGLALGAFALAKLAEARHSAER